MQLNCVSLEPVIFADQPSLLIEHWLPIEAIGAESKRERGASSALPPLYFLHVWWARRPLIDQPRCDPCQCAAAVVA